MSEGIKLTPEEQAEVESLIKTPLTTTQRIARDCDTGAMTAKELAEMLNISPKTIFKLARAGRIPSFRIGAAVRFDRRLVINWLRKQKRGTQESSLGSGRAVAL